ncbi:saal1 isoform X1 isoform A [Micractinium conductrix]|uniref:Saal1 isoform X1 n=1 Tax=Micractinium conductrix TaxID=554055 RepID=A0A2P6V162_9CHLO|nr:saal1 isoform X1 [Micractinium conductrix]PSC67823.1 saal1 isoform X1 isoform A [Micractinium conductrix]|eukprot:PSC67077.1 saal1 isoform X1 [Micractinium conductrix]
MLSKRRKGSGEEEPLEWEEAGCLVWDVAALADDAAFLVAHGMPALLPALVTATAAAERWRALEIALGVAGNLACHADARRALLEEEALPGAVLEAALWVDDAAALDEACRCAAALLPTAGDEPGACERWWALVCKEETLGRLVWVVENTLSSALLERALNLLAAVVTAASAAQARGEADRGALVPLLLSLRPLPLVASVLHGWIVELQAERRQFGDEQGALAGGGGGGGDDGGGGGGGEGEGGSAGAPDAGPVPMGASAALEGDAAAGGAVAAAVTEPAAMEALGLLEAFAADPGGEAALNASGLVKDALLRTVAESEHRCTQAFATTLLAGLDDVGPLLLASPAAMHAVLRRLSALSRDQPGKRHKADTGTSAAAAAANTGGVEEQMGGEAEAGWALCSVLARSLTEARAASAVEPSVESKVLGVLAGAVPALCHDWSGSPRGAAIRAHQAYTLRCLAPLLAARLEGDGAATLAAAIERAAAAAQT